MVWSIVSKATKRSRRARSETFPQEVSHLQCEGGRFRCYGWSGRQTGKDEGGCYLTGGC